MASSIPLQIAETIQTASINRSPSPRHDINPSTSASQTTPVDLVPQRELSDSTIEKYAYSDTHSDDIDGEEEEEDIPYSVLKPIPRARRQSFGPLPDLRFEQSYLASIAGADTKWKVVMITIRDQVLLPLLQGTLWTLALQGFRYWNRSAQLSGASFGSKLRRWWYKTNNWTLPPFPTTKEVFNYGENKKLAKEMSDVSFQYLKALFGMRGWGYALGWRWAGGVDVWSFC